MADSTVGSLTNPTSVLIGTIPITGVQRIEWDVPRTLIPSPPADSEVHGGTPVQGSSQACVGTITFSNPYTADQAGSLSGTLTASAAKTGGETARTLTITNLVFGEPNANLPKDATGTATLPFMAGSADGTASPVSWA